MRIRTLVAFIAIFLINAIGPLRWINFDYVIVDLAETIYHVKELGLGRVPYRDIFSHHALGYLLPFRLVELFTPVTPGMLKLMSILFNFISCILVYCVIKSLGFTCAALWGALVTATIGWFPQWSGDTFNNQSYSLPLCYLALLLLVRSHKTSSNRSYLYAWLAFGGMLTFDHRLLVFAPVMGLPVFCGTIKLTWNSFIKAAIAFGLAPGIAFLWLGLNGALQDLWQQTIVFPLMYRNHGQSDLLRVLARLVIDIGIISSPIESTLFAVGALSLLRFEQDRFVRLLFILWMFLGVIYITLGGRDYPHYLLIFAPCVVLIISLAPQYLKISSIKASKMFYAATTIAIVIGVTPFITEYRRHGSPFVEPDGLVVADAASFIKQNTRKSDDILVWGYAPAIYLLSERFSNFRDMGLISVAGANYGSILLEDQGLVPSMIEEFKRYLREIPPKIFVFYQKNNIDCRTCFGVAPLQLNFDFNKVSQLDYLLEFIRTRCTMLKTFDSSLDRAEVYKCMSSKQLVPN